MNSFATLGIVPDITFVLDVDIEEGLNRAGCEDRIENKGLEFHRKVRDGYYKLVADDPTRMFIVKVQDSPQDTQGEIRRIFSSVFT